MVLVKGRKRPKRVTDLTKLAIQPDSGVHCQISSETRIHFENENIFSQNKFVRYIREKQAENTI